MRCSEPRAKLLCMFCVFAIHASPSWIVASGSRSLILCLVGGLIAFEMTIAEFRKMALEIPTAVERSHMNHPDFRVAGKIFASLGVPDNGWAMVKLTLEQQRIFIEKAPKVFKPCNGAWGRQGATNVYLADAKASIVRAALDAAAKNIVAHGKKNLG